MMCTVMCLNVNLQGNGEVKAEKRSSCFC